MELNLGFKSVNEGLNDMASNCESIKEEFRTRIERGFITASTMTDNQRTTSLDLQI